MTKTSLLHDAIHAAAVRQMQRERHATLSDRDLDDISAQIDETVPVYVPTLIRELREARAALALLTEARR